MLSDETIHNIDLKGFLELSVAKLEDIYGILVAGQGRHCRPFDIQLIKHDHLLLDHVVVLLLLLVEPNHQKLEYFLVVPAEAELHLCSELLLLGHVIWQHGVSSIVDILSLSEMLLRDEIVT